MSVEIKQVHIDTPQVALQVQNENLPLSLSMQIVMLRIVKFEM